MDHSLQQALPLLLAGDNSHAGNATQSPIQIKGHRVLSIHLRILSVAALTATLTGNLHAQAEDVKLNQIQVIGHP